MLTRARLKEIFWYCPLDGKFIYVKNRGKMKVGATAGSLDKDGYRVIRVEGKLYMAHRLAWLYMTGAWPVNEIDHKDLNRSNNCFNNLRQSTHAQNMQNTSTRISKSGLKGVRQVGKRWQAFIFVNKKSKHLGMFDSPNEAYEFRSLAAQLLHGEFSNL